MKIKFTLLLAAFLIHAVSVGAQLPTEFSTGDAFSIRSKSKTIDQPALSPQNGEGNFNAFAASKNAAPANQLSTGKPNANCDGFNSVLAPEAAPCNGASVTSIVFNSASKTIVSGTDNTVGVVYRYANAGRAPDGTALDALVTVLSYRNNQDADQTNFSEADVPAATAGYEENLQPNINQESGTFLNNSYWQGSINYRIQFVVSGTTTPRVITVAATTTDNDGAGVCGSTLRESVTYSNALNQVLTSTTTTQTVSGNVITGPTTNQANIGNGQDYANAALYINVSEINWAYSFTTPTTAACTAGGGSAARYGSLNLSCQITFDQPFDSVPLSGTVFNDTNGLTDSTVNGTGTGLPGGTQLYANLLDANNNVVSVATVAANGTYTFPTAFAGSYNVQISTNRGVESSPAPALTLPAGWVSTGEFLGTGTGSDGAVNGLLSVTVAAAAIANADFGIEQRPVASTNTAANQTNPGGTNNATVPATVFTATDTAPGNVANIRITGFPTNATTITINGTQYTAATFPAGGVTVPTNPAGNPSQPILVDPLDGTVTVVIRYVAIDNAGVPSSPDATAASANIPFLAPTAANGEISGRLHFGEIPLRDALVVLYDAGSGSKSFTRTDADGEYIFTDRQVGGTYIVQPLSSKYSFSTANSVVNLLENATEINFDSSAKTYRPKNDFDGDGKSDQAVFRPSEGNWYVLRSSDDQLSVFNFGLAADIPVSADFDGDGKTDYAVFRPSEGNWYIWQSKTQKLRVENFGLADDKLVPADFDGDGKADIAVYRNGFWYVRRSSDGSFESKSFGLNTDIPVVQDFDGDRKTDLAVYRPSEGVWYKLRSSNDNFSSERFGSAADVPVSGDFDGDGFADIAQFRSGVWYVSGSTTGFEASQFGSVKDNSIVGDYDGDGRADTAVFRKGFWSIRNSGDGTVRRFNFGLATDILVK